MDVVHNKILTYVYNDHLCERDYLDSKVHGAYMRPTWVLSAQDGPHVGPMNLVIRVGTSASPLWKSVAPRIVPCGDITGTQP